MKVLLTLLDNGRVIRQATLEADKSKAAAEFNKALAKLRENEATRDYEYS